MSTLPDRMKRYESATSDFLSIRTPVIMRLDGKAFSTYTRGRKKPYDKNISLAMQFATQHLVKTIQGAKFGYTQSDEISILITDYDNLETQGWYDYKIQKMVSVATSYVTLMFNRYLHELDMLDGIQEPPKDAFFDCRVFNIPQQDVCNYFIWRQQDCKRNSITMVSLSQFSHKLLNGKSGNEKIEMLKSKGIDFYKDVPLWASRGCAYFKSLGYEYYVRNETNCDVNIPLFTDDREYVEKHVYIEE